jgi:hypothetical protein
MSADIENAIAFKEKLLEEGIIKEDGNGLHPVDDPNERVHIKEERARASKQKSHFHGAPDGDQFDAESHRSFRSAVDEEDLEDMS